MLKMQTGHEMLGTVVPIKGKSITFVAEDGGPLFEVTVRGNRELEVRARMICKVDGAMCGEQIIIRPNCANSIVVGVADAR